MVRLAGDAVMEQDLPSTLQPSFPQAPVQEEQRRAAALVACPLLHQR